MEDKKEEAQTEPRRRRTDFDDALRGYYQDHDEVRPDENADYRSLTAESVGSLILGGLSILVFVSGLFLIFPILGVILGVTAIRKILRASEELSGLGISNAGVALSILFAVSGSIYLYYSNSFSTPPGYVEIDFERLAADPRTGRIPPEILNLAVKTDEQGNPVSAVPVFIEGYMFQTRKMNDIDSFVLVPALDQSRFGTVTRRPTEMIEVHLNGFGVSYRTTPVRVGGLLYVNENPASGELPYRLEADVFR